MASSVYYKFKAQRDESKVSFDGTGISVFDLKKEIILANNLKANDFDILLYDPATNQGTPVLVYVFFAVFRVFSCFVEYTDDTFIIPRSSSVIAKRVPARPGKGKGSAYAVASAAGATSSRDREDNAQREKSLYSTTRARVGTGSLSMRFDKREESPKPPRPTVCLSSFLFLLLLSSTDTCYLGFIDGSKR